eukprot:GAHX01001255.1.p1 GENE.GAHX01001255.1~~GAHX01001255.1.p1  ORF type:complete len:626 (+),score=133.98 GAHX01001255.1:35-1912(+)
MDNLENTEALETINVYDKADLKEQHELFRSRAHSFRDYVRIYSPYLLCGILLILAISTLFSLVTFLEDSSNYKTALSACSAFINDSRLTPEGKYFTTFVTNKDPRIQTTAHKKRYVLQNCSSLLKELHTTSGAFNYKQTLGIFNKALTFDNITREKLDGNNPVPYNSVKYTEMNLVVFKNLLVFKDFILQITDFKKEDTSNKDVKPVIESLTSTTPGGTNRDALKTMNLLFINNYSNVTEKIKKKWDNLLDFKGPTGTIDEPKLKLLDEKISLLINDGIRKKIEAAITNYLKTNYSQVFPDYASLHYAPKKPNLFFEDVEKIKDLLKYFEPILNNDSIEKKPKSDVDATLEETNVKKEVNINSVYFLYQSLYIFFKKDFESVLKYFASLIDMDDFVTFIIKSENITKITKEVFTKAGAVAVDPLMKDINTKLINIASYYNSVTNTYKPEYTAQLKNTAAYINGLIDKETDKNVFGMEAKSVPMPISSLALILRNLDNNKLAGLVINSKPDISYYQEVTDQLNLSRLRFKGIDDEVKDRFVKLKVKKEVQKYIKRKFDEFGFYNNKTVEIVNLLKEIKELNSKRFVINGQLDAIIFGNDDTSVFGQFLKKLIEFIKNNKEMWDEDK